MCTQCGCDGRVPFFSNSDQIFLNFIGFSRIVENNIWTWQPHLGIGAGNPGSFTVDHIPWWTDPTITVMLMVLSYCTGTGPVQGQEPGTGSMGSNMSYRNVHTGLRKGQRRALIVSYCVSPIPCTGPIPCPMQCVKQNGTPKGYILNLIAITTPKKALAHRKSI